MRYLLEGLAVIALAACGGAQVPTIAESIAPTGGATLVGRTASPRATSPPRITGDAPSIDGRFSVDADGRVMVIKCWGDGPTTVVFDGGVATIEQFQGEEVTDRVAAEARVCLFDHAGRGDSDPAPNEPRDADDLTDDIHALLSAAGVNHDLVLVGSSFGGFTMAYYASRFPEETSGVVTLDTPAPSAELNLENFPEGVWDYPGNVEHLNVLTGFENRFAREQIHLDVPLIIVRASEGQTALDDHYWLEANPGATEVDLQGGHDIYLDPHARLDVAELILTLLH